MKIAVVGDALLDIETHGSMDGVGTEGPAHIFKGQQVRVLAGGAANVANLLTEARATCDLYVDGPGQGERAWIGGLLKQVCRANRVVWSNQGSVGLKMRGIDEAQAVTARIDAEEAPASRSGFRALEALAHDVAHYDAVVVSDYNKGCVNPSTEEAIWSLVMGAKVCVVDSKRTDYSIWRGATVLVPNVHEAQRIYGTTDPQTVREMVGCKGVFVTRGAESVLGSWEDGQAYEIEVPQVCAKAYTVGAGDAFAVGVTLALAKGGSFLEAGMAGVERACAYVQKPRKSALR